MTWKRYAALPPKKQTAFLETLAATGNVRKAAQAAHLAVSTVYKYRLRDASLAEAWDEALQVAMDTVLEPEAIRRAVEGVEQDVYYQGRKVGVERQYSDVLLIFLLKGWKADRYRERREIIHAGSLALLRKMEQVGKMTPAELQAFLLEVEQHVNNVEAEGRP